jgi:glycosyltransferase involved in cell wall biosynthesis
MKISKKQIFCVHLLCKSLRMTDKPPFFSIVIPTYNRADLILETLETVFFQSFKDYEVVVVDNQSTDNTEDVLRDLITAQKIKFIKHDKNYERSVSRNTGMLNAKGKYLTFLDSDDFLYKDCLKDAYDYALAHSEIKIFQNKFELVDNAKKPIYQYEFPDLKNQYKALCNGNFISCIGVFLQEEIYKSYKFNVDPKLVGSEDYEIWFRIVGNYKMGRIDKINAGVRQHEARSVVNTNIYDNLGYQQQVINDTVLNDPQLTKKYEVYLSRFNAWAYLNRALRSKTVDHLKHEKKLLWTALKTDFSIVFKLRFYKILYNFIK